jgi:hypothetical protein
LAVAALVPGRTKQQCRNRWRLLDPSIDRTTALAGRWLEDEDKKLKDSVQAYGGKSWEAVAALVPGRTKQQCRNRWRVLDPSIDRTTALAGKWFEDEDKKLKDSVQAYGGKSWEAIAALVPGRTKQQCQNRWRVLDPNRP